MPTCDIYLRLSDWRAESALDGRQEALLAEAARRGWIVNRVVKENDSATPGPDGKMRPASAFKRRAARDRHGNVIRDPDTGKPVMRVYREGWQGIIADIKTGRVTAVLAEDLDRACRDPRDLEDLLDACASTGATAASLSGSLKLTNGGDDGEVFMARIMVAQANKSSRDTGRRVAAARERLHGKSYGGGRRPYGYFPAEGTTKYNRQLEIVDAEAAVLQAVAADILAGCSLRAVVKDLNARGVLSARGGRWTVQALRHVLLKPTVAGLAGHNGHTVTATWKPILDHDTVWLPLVTLLTDPDRQVNKSGSEPRWLLSKIAKCGICGDVETMRGKDCRDKWQTGPDRTVEVTGTYPSYVCSSGAHLRRNAKHVDDYVSRMVIRWLDRHAKDGLKPPPSVEAQHAAILRGEAGRIQHAQTEQITLHREGLISTGQLRASLREFKDRLGVIDAQLARSDQPDPIPEFRAGHPAAVVWEALPLPRKRAIVRLLMDVTILPALRRGPGPQDDAIRIDLKEGLL
jgi:DNA invertase Pin-like site-specific DNA recombinase